MESLKLYTFNEVAYYARMPFPILELFEKVGVLPLSIFADGRMYTYRQRELVREMWARVVYIGCNQPSNMNATLHTLKEELAYSWNEEYIAE